MKFNSLLIGIFVTFFSSYYAQEIHKENLKKDVSFLASEALQGRLTGSEGEKLAAEYIAERFKSLGLEPLTEEGSYFSTFDYRWKPRHQEDAESIPITGINVSAFLDNGANYTVIIGAHYDHLGKGEYGGSRAGQDNTLPHFGADDNASGVAGVLALAEWLSKNERREDFNFIFACFSGEEQGLIGSKAFVNDSKFSKENISYMINFDMIGRLDSEKRKLFVYGVGTAPEWVDLVTAVNDDRYNFQLIRDSTGMGPSDHTSFYLAQIPVLYFHTGVHDDYHKPDDTADKINYKGEAEVLSYVYQLIEKTESIGKMKYLETKNTTSDRPRFKVTLGITPDYSWQNTGVRLDGVADGKPAKKAGMQAGDIILSIGQFATHSMHDYMKVLGHYNPGDVVDAVILRGEDKITLKLEF